MAKNRSRNKRRVALGDGETADRLVMTDRGFERATPALSPGQTGGVVHVPQFMNLSGQTLPPKRGTRELQKLYSESPWLRAIVSKIARAVAGTDWVLFAKKNNLGRYIMPSDLLRNGKLNESRLLKHIDTAELDVIYDHPMLEFLETGTGNPRLNGFSAMEVTQKHLDLVGEAFWLLEPNNLGMPIAFWPLPPSWIQDFPSNNSPNYVITVPGGMTVSVPATMIVPFIDPDPDNPYGRGSGIAKSLDDEIQIDEYSAKHSRSFFLNRARPDIIISGQFINHKDAERLEKQWLSDHQGFWKCHDETTEVLTKNGWKLGIDVSKKDLVATWNEEKQSMEYQHPTAVYGYDVETTMHHWHGQKMDALVTPNHGMWIRLGQNSEWRREESSQAMTRSTVHLRHAGVYAGEINTVIIPAVEGNGKGRTPAGLNDELMFDAVEFAKLIGFIISEGHVEDTRVSMSQGKTGSVNKPAIIAAMAEAVKLFDGFTHLSDDCNTYAWRITHKGFATWALENIGRKAIDKHLPAECFEWVLEAKLALLNSLILGDGQWRRGKGNSATYWTISKRLADDIQRLAVECGYRTTVRQAVSDTPHGELQHYRIAITKQPLSCLQRGVASWPEPVHYKGMVWCATVPNGTMFTRRNGQVLLSGNSFKPLFFSQKIDVKELSHTFESMQMVQLRKYERDTFVNVFGIPPEKIGLIGESKRSTIQAADLFWNKDVIKPRVEMIRRVMQQVLTPRFDERLILYYETPVIQEDEFKLEAMKAAPWASTVNEWRKMQGQPSLGPKGNVHLFPANMQPVGYKEKTYFYPAIDKPEPPVQIAPAADDSEKIDAKNMAHDISEELISAIERKLKQLIPSDL